MFVYPFKNGVSRKTEKDCPKGGKRMMQIDWKKMNGHEFSIAQKDIYRVKCAFNGLDPQTSLNTHSNRPSFSVKLSAYI